MAAGVKAPSSPRANPTRNGGETHTHTHTHPNQQNTPQPWYRARGGNTRTPRPTCPAASPRPPCAAPSCPNGGPRPTPHRPGPGPCTAGPQGSWPSCRWGRPFLAGGGGMLCDVVISMALFLACGVCVCVRVCFCIFGRVSSLWCSEKKAWCNWECHDWRCGRGAAHQAWKSPTPFGFWAGAKTPQPW